ncbi:GntR family transcriptional regulator [Microbacterium sp. MEC084]|uniref:GntR family transcriptional regulator n=1 Tax=Microbacterium sp. MEC084 TaxID=1963027 RepID=UPI0011021D48|nr:GntR family transcriptional regulator [Microbacterium sp. MEC084]
MIDTLEVPSMRLSDMVAERIATAIIDGTMPAGSRVRDQELAQKLGVSRMPVREALQRLQRVGLIETAASRYTRVTAVTPEVAQATRQFAGHYVTSLMRMALAAATPEARVTAAAEIDAMVAELDAGGSPAVAYRELQALFMRVADNAFMSMVSSDLGLAIERNLATLDGPDGTQVAAMLRDLRDAVLDGDAAAGARVLQSAFGVEDE